MFEDKVLVCKDCGCEFVFTAGEQEFYAERNFQTQPQRCHDCRKRRKYSTGEGKPPVYYEIVCSKCGKVEKIPFEPRHDKPVFCGNCYKEVKGR